MDGRGGGGDFQRGNTAPDDGLLVIGGGVAGSTCAIELKRLSPCSKVTLVSPSSAIKEVLGVKHITPWLGVVDIHERSVDEFSLKHPGISLICDEVTSVDADRSQAKLATGGIIRFSRCCVATGASPSLASVHPRVIGIRDTESVEHLSKRLAGAKRVLIVGNGGIALELVHALISSQACQVVWAVRDTYVGNTFFDPSASAFVLPSLSAYTKPHEDPASSHISSLPPPSTDSASRLSPPQGSAHGYRPGGAGGSVDRHGLPSQSETRDTLGDLPQCVPDSGSLGAAGKCLRDADSNAVGKATAFCGPGLGPDWVQNLNIQGSESGYGDTNGDEDAERSPRQPLLDIQFGCELDDVRDGEGNKTCNGARWPVSAALTNGVVVDCDFIVSATGVIPNTGILGVEFERGRDGALVVDEMMRVTRASDTRGTLDDKDSHHGVAGKDSTCARGASRSDNAVGHRVFAAGDCCCLERLERESAHWFQVRLWSQARAMGLYAAKCMTDSVDELGSGGAFDLFVHATQFFGHKVALLGRFNGQGLGMSVQDFVSKYLKVDPKDGAKLQGGAVGMRLEQGSSFPLERYRQTTNVKAEGPSSDDDIQVLVRTTSGVEYVKVVIVRGRVRGAMLIGDTGLEETFENLILSGIDVSNIGADLLSPDVDIEDFFD